jgi:N-acetylglucosaminyldiphosphoundecaprenol N-acetyl-beta-D-mannosaminyltransferase
MMDQGKHNVLGVLIDAVDYEGAAERIITAARSGRPLAATALAVHGVMTGYADHEQRARLNHLDLVVPDGQPVRWALNLLHGTRLPDRVYGPELTLRVCQAAQREGLPIYLYGSTPAVLERFQHGLCERFPGLSIAGAEPSKFRRLSKAEKSEVAIRIRASGARIVFVGLGCPRQEIWAYEYRESLGIPIIAVGAAFDFHAGTTKQAPRWMQDYGLEWFFRFRTEPRRLWRRYVILNPWYVGLVAAQFLRLRRFSPGIRGPVTEVSHG